MQPIDDALYCELEARFSYSPLRIALRSSVFSWK